jgi:Ni,Fe-hydrogenase III small subunit/formate hydrogenlyase subunit 6/NADH:ubiquinone oxidoreductase subunit I
MLDIFIERLRQKQRTIAYPASSPSLPRRFRGRPFIDAERCLGVAGKQCGDCAAVCPTGAIRLEKGAPALDMGQCSFCGNCAAVCPRQALVFTTDWRLGSTERDALIIRPLVYVEPPAADKKRGEAIQSLPEDSDRFFRLPELPIQPYAGAGGAFLRSFRLRQVTAAGCGACEADLNVLSTVVFDLGRFGMDFVASPRHADGLVLTGPVPRNMRDALIKCRRAMPAPKPVLAVGVCAISGGLFRAAGGREDEVRANGASTHVPVDLYIPGCPPHPYTSLEALLRFVGREAYKPFSS